jgi:hypothetical protein
MSFTDTTLCILSFHNCDWSCFIQITALFFIQHIYHGQLVVYLYIFHLCLMHACYVVCTYIYLSSYGREYHSVSNVLAYSI